MFPSGGFIFLVFMFVWEIVDKVKELSINSVFPPPLLIFLPWTCITPNLRSPVLRLLVLTPVSMGGELSVGQAQDRREGGRQPQRMSVNTCKRLLCAGYCGHRRDS